MWTSVFYPVNAFLVVLIVAKGVFSPRLALRPAIRLALVGAFSLFDACLILWMEPRTRAVAYWALIFVLAAWWVPQKPIQSLTRALGKARFPIYLLSVTMVAGLVYAHLPIATFFSSPGEIGTHFPYLTRHNVRDGIAAIDLAMLAYAVMIETRLRSALTFLALMVAALALVYAYVLPFGYPVMSGLTFEQTTVPTGELFGRGLADCAVIFATSALMLWVLARFRGRSIAVALIIVNVSLVLGSAIRVGQHVDESEGNLQSQQAVGPPADKPFAFSPSQPNVLIIFLDRFMGGFVEEILRQQPELKERLDGFTWYPRTLAAGQNSIAGVHPTFGGYDYLPAAMNARNQPLKELSVEAYQLLPYNFGRKGYQVHFVNPRGLGFTIEGNCSYMQMSHVHCTHIDSAISRRRAAEVGMPLAELATENYAELLTLLGSMRTSPYTLKESILRFGRWGKFIAHSAGTTFRQWAELKALPELTNTRSNEKNFNIVWSILPHEPHFIGEDCQPRRARLLYNDAEVHQRGHSSLFELQHAVTARCALMLVADYLDFLKKAGVYDTTKIVVVSDHGIVGDAEDHSSRAVQGGTTANIFVRSRSLLLVKEENKHGDLAVSEEFRPNADVPQIVCEQIGGCVNPHLDDKPLTGLDKGQPFPVTLVPWRFSAQKPHAFVIEREMALVGDDPYDAAAWRNLP